MEEGDPRWKPEVCGKSLQLCRRPFRDRNFFVYSEDLVERSVTFFCLPADAQIVDLGSGSGGLTHDFSVSCVYPKIVEVDPNFFDNGREVPDHPVRKWILSIPRHRFNMQTAENTGLTAGRYDLVVMGDSFQHFDFDRTLAECRRLLKPVTGGVAIFTTYSCDQHRTPWQEYLYEIGFPTGSSDFMAGLFSLQYKYFPWKTTEERREEHNQALARGEVKEPMRNLNRIKSFFANGTFDFEIKSELWGFWTWDDLRHYKGYEITKAWADGFGEAYESALRHLHNKYAENGVVRFYQFVLVMQGFPAPAGGS